MAAQAKPGVDSVLRARSFCEELVLHLQQDIITGVFQPGQRIVERELIARFGVSSIPVREALQDLESRGLLTRKLNHGYTVVQLTYEDAQRICELRRLLEPKVVRWAAERITGEEVEGLERQLEQFNETVRGGDMAAFFHADLRFHRLIWQASGNPYAAKSLESSMGTLFAAGLARNERDTKAEKAAAIDRPAEVEKHRRMLRAIKAGDGERAARELLEIATGFERQFLRDE